MRCPDLWVRYTDACTGANTDHAMNLNQTVILSPDVISQEVSGETVLLDLESERYFGLDAVGTRIWQLIRESGELRTVYNTLLDEYEVEEAHLRADLAALLTDACARGLITLRDAP
jgi:Coenzyme PQQ synthesis protein D (PqqD)